MRQRGILILPALCALAACPTKDVAEQEQSRIIPSRATIMGKVYDSGYTVPAGFYTDERADTPGSYTVHHVKDESAAFEVCAYSLTDALALEQADADSRSVQGYFVEAVEHERYYEVVRELSYQDGAGNVIDPTSPGFARVFRCDYVDRSGVNRNGRNGYAGRLHGDNVSATEIRTVSEYLWQFTFFWPAEKNVLQTFSSDLDSYTHTLVLALKTHPVDDACDRIDVVDWVFSLDPESGEMTMTFNPLFSFEAQLVDGTPRECG